MLKEAFFAVAASREPKMDRVRAAMLIAALVVDVGRWLSRRCGSVVPPSSTSGTTKSEMMAQSSARSDSYWRPQKPPTVLIMTYLRRSK